jgi:hypothetical protein
VRYGYGTTLWQYLAYYSWGGSEQPCRVKVSCLRRAHWVIEQFSAPSQYQDTAKCHIVLSYCTNQGRIILQSYAMYVVCMLLKEILGGADSPRVAQGEEEGRTVKTASSADFMQQQRNSYVVLD